MPFDELSNILTEEVLTEMAENFFGARRNLEALMEGFQSLAARLRGVEILVRARFGVLHHLLLRGREARAFYEALGLDPGLADFAGPELLRPTVKPGFALTLKSRYAGTVLAAYAEARQEAHDYMHGRSYVDHQDHGKRKVTVNYRQLETINRAISDKVRQVNRNMTPSGVMQYVKSFKVEESARERVAGVPEEGYAENLDQGLAFQPIDFASLGLAKLPDLPEPKDVARAMRSFCDGICERNRREVAEVLDELKTACSSVACERAKGLRI